MSNERKIPITPQVLAKPLGYWDDAVGIDFDEVIGKFTQRAEDHINTARQESGSRKPADLNASRTYYYYRDFEVTNVNKDEFGMCMQEMSGKHKGGFGDLDFHEGAAETVIALREFGTRPFIITNVPGALETSGNNNQPYPFGGAQDSRRKQLFEKQMIQRNSDIIFCDAFHKPIKMLDGIYKIPVLIDDRQSTLVSARTDHGLIAVGIRTPMTQHMPDIDDYGVVWFDSLQDALPALKDLISNLRSLGLTKPCK